MDAALGKSSDVDVSARFGLKRQDVLRRRQQLRIDRYSTRNEPWTPERDALLGSDTDTAVAKVLRLEVHQVSSRRSELRIADFVNPAVDWTPQKDALLGKDTAPNVAAQLGVSPQQVSYRMKQLGIPAFVPPPKQPNHHRWTPKQELVLYENLLSTDSVLSDQLGVSIQEIEERRTALGIRRIDTSNRATMLRGARYLQLYIAGHSSGRIAADFRITAGSVTSAIHAAFRYLRRLARYDRMPPEVAGLTTFTQCRTRSSEWLALCSKALHLMQAEEGRIAEAHRRLLSRADVSSAD